MGHFLSTFFAVLLGLWFGGMTLEWVEQKILDLFKRTGW